MTVFLVNGFQMRGVITGFDSFVVILESDGKQQMLYKHADLDDRARSRPVDLNAPRRKARRKRALITGDVP